MKLKRGPTQRMHFTEPAGRAGARRQAARLRPGCGRAGREDRTQQQADFLLVALRRWEADVEVHRRLARDPAGRGPAEGPGTYRACWITPVCPAPGA